ncbi:peptidase M4 family protein [Sinorhizobium meliloti]|uniref:M4 family metallopeptidase n=1 Tax=Rhizobium meliloti TaxID=382 RepID=UPI0012977505|nr:M4 family metallopeptidase [Sinorhizobium meliloti]MQW42543.1 peptidase M4 family protein [Sinorhizobium meliloti]
MQNGLKSIRLHRGIAGADDGGLSGLTAVDGAEAERIAASDPESAARRYLNMVMGTGSQLVELHDTINGEKPEYKYLGVDKIPFTNSQHVKFRQYYNKIPIYGSLVTVELGPNNGFVSINTSIGDPANVDPTAKVSPSEALQKVKKLAGYTKEPLNEPARLTFYFDQSVSRWRLVYIIEDVLRLKPRGTVDKDRVDNLPASADFVIDAHTGELVDELPRMQTMAAVDAVDGSVDLLGTLRRFNIVRDSASNVAQLLDRSRNIRTHDFGFRDAFFQQAALPGRFVTSPPAPWDPSAVSAHANAQEVVDFLRTVLQRDGLDNRGGAVISSVNCVFQNFSGGQVWRNAARFRGQMIYGQRMVNGTLRSYAASLDVVAHELLHGLTDNTARLEYRFQSGALNESYSDIFGVIVSNIHEQDMGQWNWQIGEDLTDTGLPLRDISNPVAFGQPAHMDDYLTLEADSDDGGVHANSGIHNRAAFNLLTAKDATGRYVFAPVEVARMYYVALVAHLSRTSGFSDCRAGMLLAVQSMFATAPDAPQRIAAVADAYDAVGIVETNIS